MKVAIPGLTRDAARPLANSVERAAVAMGLDDVTALRFTTYLFEYMAEEIARGDVVTIPSYGAFGVWLDERYRTRTSKRIVFSPSAAFKAQVNLTTPHTRKPKKKIQVHRDHNGFDPDRKYTHKRVWSTMEEIRRSIDAQMAEG